MKSKNVRGTLRQASEAIERAATAAETSEVEGQLTGVARQLRYYLEGDPTDPEAVVAPRPDTLDTMQRTVTDVMNAEDEDVARELREARKQLLLSIVTLDDRRKKQHHSFATPDDER